MEDDLIEGVRCLSVNSFLEPDPLMAPWTVLDQSSGQTRRASARDWARQLLATGLGEHVPDELRKAFEVARAPMVYAYFYYPLYALAAGQLLQVSERAVSIAAKRAGAPAKCRSFMDKLQWLRDHDYLSENEHAGWNAGRELRNTFVHEGKPSAIPPGMAVGQMNAVAQEINDLFRTLSQQPFKE